VYVYKANPCAYSLLPVSPC